MERIQNFINGSLCDSVTKNFIDNYNPAEGKVYSHIPDSNADDVALAVDAANAAFDQWSNIAVEKRSAILLKIADLVDRDLDKLALAESTDSGKPVKLAK